MKLLRLNIIALLILALLTKCNNEEPEEKIIVADNKMDTVSYALGTSFATNFHQDGLDTLINKELVVLGILDVLNKDTLLISLDDGNRVLDKYFRALEDAKIEEKYGGNKTAGEEFLRKNKTKDSVEVTQSGLQYKVIRAGYGIKPKLTDEVLLHYRISLIDGTIIDDTYKNLQPVNFEVGEMIEAWIEALQKMKVGAKWRLYVPYYLAYGKQGTRNIEPYTTLIFDIDLLAIKTPQNNMQQ